MAVIQIVVIFLNIIPTYSFGQGTSTNDFVLIENQVDGEYFISTRRLDGSFRFSGSNRISKYNVGQTSLGYMGRNDTVLGAEQYYDMWLEDSPVDFPFVGQTCRSNESGCPSDFIHMTGLLKNNGVYGLYNATRPSGVTARKPYAVLADGMYEYFSRLPIQRPFNLTFNYCVGNRGAIYNIGQNQTCDSYLADNEKRSRRDIFNLTKTANILLKSTNALQEIYIDSDGNTTPGLGSDFCKSHSIGNVNGISCLLAETVVEGDGAIDLPNNNQIALSVNSANLGNVPLFTNEVRFSGDQVVWYNGASRTYVYAYNVLKKQNKGIYVFLSQSYLKKLVDYGVDLGGASELFTFLFRNTSHGSSGYYEFTPSNTLLLRPRDYGVSIVDRETWSVYSKKEGKVGVDEPDIVFKYIITASGPRNADEVKIRVGGDKEVVNGINYCLFQSSDKSTKVVFPSYIQYLKSSNTWTKVPHGCGDRAVDLTDARWEQTPWVNAPEEGSFYRTLVDFGFSMSNPISNFTVDNRIDWEGVVRAQGTIQVEAIWRNVPN